MIMYVAFYSYCQCSRSKVCWSIVDTNNVSFPLANVIGSHVRSLRDLQSSTCRDSDLVATNQFPAAS